MSRFHCSCRRPSHQPTVVFALVFAWEKQTDCDVLHLLRLRRLLPLRHMHSLSLTLFVSVSVFPSLSLSVFSVCLSISLSPSLPLRSGAHTHRRGSVIQTSEERNTTHLTFTDDSTRYETRQCRKRIITSAASSGAPLQMKVRKSRIPQITRF